MNMFKQMYREIASFIADYKEYTSRVAKIWIKNHNSPSIRELLLQPDGSGDLDQAIYLAVMMEFYLYETGALVGESKGKWTIEYKLRNKDSIADHETVHRAIGLAIRRLYKSDKALASTQQALEGIKGKPVRVYFQHGRRPVVLDGSLIPIVEASWENRERGLGWVTFSVKRKSLISKKRA